MKKERWAFISFTFFVIRVWKSIFQQLYIRNGIILPKENNLRLKRYKSHIFISSKKKFMLKRI